jgi:hypothetical protein
MKKNRLNWQQQAQDAIYETITQMTPSEELAFWQQETVRLRERRQRMQNKRDLRHRLANLLDTYPRYRSSSQ